MLAVCCCNMAWKSRCRQCHVAMAVTINTAEVEVICCFSRSAMILE